MKRPQLPALSAALSAAILAAALSLQACGTAGRALFRGDRVTIDRDFIYLDDPVFLQSKSAYGQRAKGGFAFRLPIYFSAGKRDTLRFGYGDVSVRIGGKPTTDGRAPAAGKAPVCVVDTGSADPDSAALARKFLDSTRTLVLSPAHGAVARIELRVYCADYNPPWGRTDTLILAFRGKTGPDAYPPEDFSLPFHVSYRGPVVSILIGTGLLYLFTQLGWWIADS